MSDSSSDAGCSLFLVLILIGLVGVTYNGTRNALTGCSCDRGFEIESGARP